jgi:hypothetical protein
MQTNEGRNRVIHYLRAPDGQITEVERHLTGAAGSIPRNSPQGLAEF